MTDFFVPNDLKRFIEKYNAVVAAVSNSKRGEDTYLLEQLQDWVQGLLDRSKFKVGDRVIVTKKLDYEKDCPGWTIYRPTFTQIGVIEKVDFYTSKFRYEVKFEREYVDCSTKKRPILHEQRHCFSFGENSIDFVPENYVAPQYDVVTSDGHGI
jgi:hypothetical protein